MLEHVSSLAAGSPPPVPMDPNVGQLVNNKYRLVRLIGDGGMGSVFEARHELLGTTVALKFLHTALARRKGLVDRFLQEAQVSARIRSPHVVRVTDVERTPEGLAYMVMEYVEGSTLQELYEQLYRMGKRLSYGEAFELVFQMLEGVGVAHAMGIVHRDLKPDNVMLTKDGANRTLVKILDFGIAKLRASGEMDRGLTKPGVVMGTPEYMAPEQAFSADKVDARADIFSLGVMFYEMLAGRRPVGGENAMAIAAQYLEGNVTQLRTLVPTIAPPLAKAVHKAMAPRPENRFSSVEDLRAAIEPFAPEGPGADVGTAAGAGKSAPERSSGVLDAALGAQRSVPRTAPSGGPEPQAEPRGAHTPHGPPALGAAADASSKQEIADAGLAARSDGAPATDPRGEGSPAILVAGAAERGADERDGPTRDASRPRDDGQAARDGASGTARGLGGDGPSMPEREPRAPRVDEPAEPSGATPAEGFGPPAAGAAHLVDATVAMGAGVPGAAADAPGAPRETAEATPFVPGAEGRAAPDAPAEGATGGGEPRDADRPGATVVGEPFDGTPFPPAAEYNVADAGGGFGGSGTQAAPPFQEGTGGIPGPQGAGPEYGVEGQVPFGGPAPAQGPTKRSRGPSVLSILMLAGAVSALVVGGVYAAQEYGSDDDDNGPARPTTEVVTTTPPSTEPLPGTTTTEFATSTTTTTSTTWSQPTTTRTATQTTTAPTTRTTTTTAPTTTTSTTSTPPIWTLPTALPTVTLPPFTFPGPRPSTVPPSTTPTTTPTSTGTATSTRPPILPLPLPKPKPIPRGGG